MKKMSLRLLQNMNSSPITPGKLSGVISSRSNKKNRPYCLSNDYLFKFC